MKLRQVKKNLGLGILRKKSGRLQVALIVNESTTLEDIHEEWNEIKALTNLVLDFQGTDPNDYLFISRLRLARMKLIEDFSYLEVAMDANFETLCNIVQAIEYKKKKEMASAYDTLGYAIKRLEGLGIKHEDALNYIVFGVEEIEQGHVPWSLYTGPVSKQRVVDFIRQIRREIKSRKIVIKENPPGLNKKRVKLSELRGGDFVIEKVEKMLEKFPNNGGLDKLKNAHLKYTNSK